MLSGRVGDELDCVVTGLASFGVFAQSRKYGIEGLIQMGDLGPDRWKFNSKSQSIIGLGSGRCVRLGECMKVRIVSVNVPARQLNVSPVKTLTSSASRTREDKRAKKSGRDHTAKRTSRKSKIRNRR